LKMSARLLTLTAIVASATAATVYPENPEFQAYLWEGFKRDHGKQYEPSEEIRRFAIFLENLKIADRRNAEEIAYGGSAVHGITKFSDLTADEFAKSFLTADVSKKTGGAEVVEITTPVNLGASLIDWTNVYTSPVKDQGYCGSCWAFSATEQIESDAMRQLKKSYVLSPAQITQCDTTSYGCNGGWSENAYNYVKKAGGLETEANYPYSSAIYNGKTGSCAAVASKEVVTITGYSTIKGESSMASYVQTTGPLSVCVDASNWSSYKSGILSVCGKSVDHCVQAVGVDVTNKYWKVRNSWATSWGESGHIRLSYGSNTCAITNDPTYVTTKLV